MADILEPLVAHWLRKIQLAWDFKRKEFQDDADECMRFFDGPYDFMYGIKYAQGSKAFAYTAGEGNQLPAPSFSMTVNKVAEIVQLYGPVLYHRNPTRKANPLKLPLLPPRLFGNLQNDPMALRMFMMMDQQTQQSRVVNQARAALMEAMLNYTPSALDLKRESRQMIDEAIIKGMGLLWTEVYRPPGSQRKMIGSFYDSCDNLLLDPDVETINECQWIARRCVHPVWQVEKEYGLEEGAIQGQMESSHQQAGVAETPEGNYLRKQGKTNDLCVYWKVFSRMGMGGRLQGIAPAYREPLESFGDFSYLVVARGCKYPLNLPPGFVNVADDPMIAQQIAWPIPYWKDDSWPFTETIFHERPRKLYPMSHLKPGLGELKFINWVYSFIASKIRATCRDFVAIKKSLSEDIKTTILSGKDLELIEIDEAHGTIKDAVEFLQHPQFNGDIWKVLEAVEANFEKRVGLTELMYAQTPVQMRSAEEARVKSGQLQVRPDDMANKVEDAMSAVARKEALASHLLLTATDVTPILGPVCAYFWSQLITQSPLEDMLFQLEYRVEAGSARKPNQDRDAANMQSAMQTLFQPLWGYAGQSGDVEPVNALVIDWAKSVNLDPEKYLIRPPPPQPMPGSPGGPEGRPGGAPQPRGQTA